MKKFARGSLIFAVSLILMAASFERASWAVGSSPIPLLSKQITPVMTAPELSYWMGCSIYPGEVLVEETQGVSGTIRKRKNIHFTGEIQSLQDLNRFITAAGSVSPKNIPSRGIGPVVAYLANQMTQSDSYAKSITLEISGARVLHNDSSAARILVDFIDVNCR